LENHAIIILSPYQETTAMPYSFHN